MSKWQVARGMIPWTGPERGSYLALHAPLFALLFSILPSLISDSVCMPESSAGNGSVSRDIRDRLDAGGEGWRAILGDEVNFKHSGKEMRSWRFES